MAKLYRFDDVEIDLQNFRVLKGGRTLSLEPKAFSILISLIENRGRLIEKRELLDAVWGDSFVTENVLTRSIAQLRKALEDDSKNARYIETVPTRGYRFIAEITEGEASVLKASSHPNPEETLPDGVTVFIPAITPRRRMRHYAIAAIAMIVVIALAAVAFSVVRARKASPYFEVASTTQITTSGGLTFYPTFSPDGTEIAYCTDRGKGFEIFVQQLVPGGKESQITSDGQQNMQPSWSPDGSLIAYSSKTRGGIWLIPAQGGTPRKLTDFGSHPSWSPDGQWIAFQSSLLDDFGADSLEVSFPSWIWVIRPDGNGARQVTQRNSPEGAHGSPSWSPDSKHITFVGTAPSGVWAIGADGTGPTRLSDPGYRDYDPVYTPDGGSILFGSIARYGDFGVYGLSQVRVDPNTSAPLEKPVQILNSSGISIKNLGFSKDGKKLIYAALGMTSTLESLPVSAALEPTGPSVSLTNNIGCRTTAPQFSPDGLRIAYLSCIGRAGLTPQLWSMNPDGSSPRQLTIGPDPVLMDSWGHDGRHVLFTSNRDYVLHSVDIDTLEQKTIQQVKRNAYMPPLLSPDGNQLLMALYINGVLNVWVEELAGGTLKQLTFDKEYAGFPVWSPDGKSIAIEIQRGPDNDIEILPREGGPATPLTPFHGRQWLHSWSPDGDKIFYAKQGSDLIWNIWCVSRSTKNEKQITHYTNTNEFVRYPEMSPRGNQLVYEHTVTIGNIWTLQFK